MAESIIKFFYETCVLAKQVKYISKIPTIRTKVLKEIIYIDLVDLITLTGYDRSKYGLFLIDNVIYAITDVLFKEKS